MRYRPFGTTGWDVSALGLGTMRLPAASRIEKMAAVEMIRNAIDYGVNFIDFGDPRFEQPFALVSEALDNGYREKVKIALGLPLASPRDLDRYMKERLRLLRTDRIDFCFLSGLDRVTWPRAQELDLPAYLDEMRSDGRIDGTGFAFHDHFLFLRGIVEGYDKWTFCRFRCSYVDIDHHPGTAGLTYAREKGLAVVITEALLSGRLVNNPPESVVDVCTQAPSRRSLAEWGLAWVLNQPQTATVVSNMSSGEQVKENVAIADRMYPDSLGVRELLFISRLRDCYRARKPVPCTTCRACMPCPAGIDAPRVFELYNEAIMYADRDTPARLYALEGHSCDCCTECGACAKACGRKIAIPEWLKKADAVLITKSRRKPAGENGR
jgi:uncharacterized protein